MESIELKRFWEKVKEELIGCLPETAHPWLYPLEVSGYDKGVLTLVTGQMMGRDVLRKNHYNDMVNILKRISQDETASINIIYDENAAKNLKKETEKIKKKAAEASMKEQAFDNLSNMQSASNLNLKYKFENFVVGDNNRFAHDTALAVAQNPSKKYNPLFIYGASGLGKTHLMQAIGHYTIFNNSKLKVKYTKTEDYINDFISNSRNSKDSIENMSKFKKKYTNIDIILIDDIQFIESKNKTMIQMQHTFDTLYNKGKQIVITSDRLPKEIPTLTAALCSRFEQGLMVELTSPDVETRYQIVKKLAGYNDLKYDNDALRYIAKHYKNNIRELEGAFTKVCAYAEVMKQNLTLELAKNVLKCDEKENVPSLSEIAEVTGQYYGVDISDLKGSARNQKVSEARQMAVYISRELTGRSYENIADFYNKKHPTIMFACDKVKKEISTNKEYSNALREIKQALKVL